MPVVTLKFRLYPTNEQAQAFDDTMEQFRRAANYTSQVFFDNHFGMSQMDLHNAVYQYLRSTFNLKSQMAVSVYRMILARYRAVKTQITQKPYHFKDANTGVWYTQSRDLDWLKNPIQFKRPQLDVVANRDWSFKGNQLSINSLAGRQIMNYSVTGFEHYSNLDGQFGTAKLVKSGKHYFLHVAYTFAAPEFSIEQLHHVVGIDRGLRFVATSFDERGKTNFYNGRQLQKMRRKFKHLRQQLQKRGTKSAKRRLKAIDQRENRWMTDVNHQLSKTLVDQYGAGTLFVLEDLTNVRFATEKSAKASRYEMVSWSFYQLEQFLAYKAEQVGGTVIKVDAHYTSQRCPKCGIIRKENRNHQSHEYHCQACDYRSNDDRIGAMNIQLLGTRWISGQSTSLNQNN